MVAAVAMTTGAAAAAISLKPGAPVEKGAVIVVSCLRRAGLAVESDSRSVAMNGMHFFFGRQWHLPLSSLAAPMVVALAWSSFAFGGEIHDAALGGDLPRVKELLNVTPDLISSKDASGYTPLHWAAAADHTDVLKFLLANNAEVNARDNKSQTPLDIAAARGHREAAKLLLAHGAEVNARTGNGWTPLFFAASEGQTDVAKLLLAHRADANARDNNGTTPLHWAAEKGHLEVVKLLLADKAEVNARNSE